MFFIDCYLFLISKSQLNSWFSHCYLVYVDYEIGACTSWLCQNHDQPHDATWDHCTWCFRKSNLDGTHVPYMILLQQSNHLNIHSHEGTILSILNCEPTCWLLFILPNFYLNVCTVFIYSKLWANMLTTLYFAQLLYMPTVLIYAYICFYICNSYRFYYSYMAIAALLLFFVAIQQILFGSSCCSFAELNDM